MNFIDKLSKNVIIIYNFVCIKGNYMKKVNNSEQVQGDGVLVDEKLAKFLFSGQWFFHNCFCLEFIICATFSLGSNDMI